MKLVKNTADQAGVPIRSLPVHEQVYQDLRSRILFGEAAPGQAVTIQGLADALGAGMTPVREAIRRLISDGALLFQGNRRVIVPTLDIAALEQLVFIRKSIESELARRAARHVGPEFVDRLSEIDAALDVAISQGDVPGYLRLNYQFHMALYAQAKASIMAEQADRLWLRFGPSLRVVCGRFGTQNLPDRHKDLLSALAAGDEEGAAVAVTQDVIQGMEQIAAVLEIRE
ncbi:FCD domain-containing protein [Sulfitobacter sp. BDSS02]|nr:FCD domain-containing protein [Sulfitobacter sp. BDSS02]MBR9851552.1 GntR family transcriptional regulator [Paracoccaceae bacterium]